MGRIDGVLAFLPNPDPLVRPRRAPPLTDWPVLTGPDQRRPGSRTCFALTCRVQNPDTQQAGRVGEAHSERYSGSKLGRTGCRHFGRPRSQPSL